MDIFTDIPDIVELATVLGACVLAGRKFEAIDRIEQTMEKMKHNIKSIADALTASRIPFDCSALKAYSPIQLTDIGRDLLARSGFISIFEEHAEDFYAYIDEEAPTNDYDIEVLSIRSVFFLFDKAYFVSMKDFLYNNPTQDRKDLMQIAGIYVRDRYHEHKRSLA